MPRYFFDVHNGGRYRDDIGTELSDLKRVREEAMKLLPSLARDDVPDIGRCFGAAGSRAVAIDVQPMHERRSQARFSRTFPICRPVP